MERSDTIYKSGCLDSGRNPFWIITYNMHGMIDENKTKEQLIYELTELRQHTLQ
jgi:hypothetical protein